MIVQNEASVIRRALIGAIKIADEIIVVDTGSIDDTKKIAESFGAKVFDFKWINNFSAARNESLRRASYSWVMWLDADDTVPPVSIDKINILKKNPPSQNAIYGFRLININPVNLDFVGGEIMQGKMFPNDSRIEFRGRVHETVSRSSREAGFELIPTDIVIEHIGYQNEKKVQKKLERNISLMLIDAGFPTDTKFFIFNVQGYNCFYSPNVMTIWRNNEYIGCCDPFDVEFPEDEERKRVLMVKRALIIIDQWEFLKKLKLESKREDELKAKDELTELNRRIEAAINKNIKKEEVFA
ncbi:MAG: glycosyltransferase family 2 protein [Ignavibacteria bacterium]|nr:glycosyltransferase family 2 protein [Ignavibacteria bacterium]